MAKRRPTPTVGIEKRWRAQYNKRFKALKGRVNRFFVNAQGQIDDATFITFFNRWFDTQINDLFFVNGAATATSIWQNRYIDQAYSRGLRGALAALAREGVELIPDSAANMTALSLIQQKSYEDLRGITAELKAQASRNLISGVQEQQNKAQLAKAVNDRIDKIGRTRSHTLANTRTTETFNTAEIIQANAASEQTGEAVKMLWITEGDSRVRTTHALRNRKLYEPHVAQRLIGEPNCRCGLRIEIGEGTAAERKQRAQVRRRQLRESKQAQQERRFFESIGTRSGNPPV